MMATLNRPFKISMQRNVVKELKDRHEDSLVASSCFPRNVHTARSHHTWWPFTEQTPTTEKENDEAKRNENTRCHLK